MKLAWHYTTLHKFIEIEECGFLRPTDIGTKPPELPILWFSMNQEWEATACKGVELPNGTRRTLNRWETFVKGGGAVRIGVDPSNLIAWPELAKKAKMPSRMIQSLVKIGLSQCAVPTEWMGSLREIHTDEWVAVEGWKPLGDDPSEGNWINLDDE